MNPMRFPSRGGVVVLVYLVVMMAGCSDDSTGPVVEEPFDPTFAVEVVQDVSGMVEADDEDVFELVGTTAAPIFGLPTGGSPDAGVQSEMAGVWSALWGMLGEGVTLLVVLENLYH